MIKSIFTEKELDYIKAQNIARIATAAAEVKAGLANKSEHNSSKIVQPDVVPVGFFFDGEYFYIGGFDMLRSTKYRNVLRNRLMALVIDDFKSVKPLHPRGIKIYGVAEITKRQGASLKKNGEFETVYSIKITPRRKWSWGIDDY
jgi:pyridoxamine 5'-phosphate oxidase family protein